MQMALVYPSALSLDVCRSVLPLCWPVCLTLSVCSRQAQSVGPFVCLSVCLFVCLFVCLSFYMFVSLSVCPLCWFVSRCVCGYRAAFVCTHCPSVPASELSVKDTNNDMPALDPVEQIEPADVYVLCFYTPTQMSDAGLAQCYEFTCTLPHIKTLQKVQTHQNVVELL